eukprot:6172663-Pleurochrysis_carterae.AAC.2
MLIVLLYVDDIITAHTRGSSLRDEWAKDESSISRWTDFGNNLQEFVSIRLRQVPGVIRLNSERYIIELANEVFPGGIHADYACPHDLSCPPLSMTPCAARETAART